MTSIVELFPKCRKLAYDARQQLAVLQQQGSGCSSSSDVMMTLNELNFQLQYMEGTLIQKEIPQQRMIWSRKIQELQQEAQVLQQQCHQLTSVNHHNYSGIPTNADHNYGTTTRTDREELLNLRQRRRQQQQQPHSTENDLQNLTRESDSIQSSHTMLVDIISSGELSYQELKAQRQRLTSMSSVLMQISETIGLSQFTMQIIERRDITDLYYVIGGMIITLIVLYVTWFM